MMRKWLCQADVSIEIEPVDPVLVKSGYTNSNGTDMSPVSTILNGKRTYYFPGTSLKGVLRSHFERIARTLQPGSVCIPYYDSRKKDICIPVEEEKESHGCSYRSSGENDASSVAYADSCAACRLFGSLKFAGRFSIGDAYPLPNHEPNIESRNGVGIDRFSGGTVKGVLFDLEALVGGRFAAKIRLANFEMWQLAGLKLLLDDLADELITVGSGRSRGLGSVRGVVKEFRLTYLKTVGKVNSLAGIGELAEKQEMEAYRLHNWVSERSIGLPAGNARGLRQQFNLDADWSQLLQMLVPAFEDFLKWHGGPSGAVSANRVHKRHDA